MYAVKVFDNTCNVIGHEEGIYGMYDYRWMNEPLNGGNGEYSINTLEEAEAVMADFQKAAEENSLEWASFGIDEIEIPAAEMEKIKDLREILKKAICECCTYADCNTMERIFECADWTWRDRVTDDEYYPTAREIRKCMYDLGIGALASLMEDYESEDWGKKHPNPKTVKSGRLFFTIDWEIEGEEVDVLRDVVMACGISNEFASTTIETYTDSDYITDTLADYNDYRGHFDRHNV